MNTRQKLSSLLLVLGTAIAGAACGGYTPPPIATIPSTTFSIVSAVASNQQLPTAIANSPYGYAFQTNVGQSGVSAIAPISFVPNAALPPGLILTSEGVLSGTPTQAGHYDLSIEAVDSSANPLQSTANYTFDVQLPGAQLTQVSHHPLGGHGQNADLVQATATATKIPYVYVGTRGSLGDCPATGVKIVDLSTITSPQLIATVGGVIGASQQEPRVAVGVSSPSFHSGSTGDLLAISEQPCDPSNVAASETGFRLFDVTDPTHPAALGTWNSGVLGVRDVAIVPIPGPLNAQGLVDHTQDKIYALAAVPFSETGTGTITPGANPEGDLRIVDITNPALPHEIGNWGVLKATGALLPNVVLGADPRVFLDSIQLSSDHKTAFLGYWDEGVVVLDVSNPAVISSGNPAIFLSQIVYPITASATTTTPSSPEGNTHEALPVVNNSELLITDDVCASTMITNSNGTTTSQSLSVPVVCGAADNVPLNVNSGWGYLRTYSLPALANPDLQSFYVTAQSVSAPPPDNGIYTAYNLAWNGDNLHPHAYVAWFSSGVVDLDLTSIDPPNVLATFVPPDSPDPNGTNPAVDNPSKAMIFGVAAYSQGGQPYILASDINSGLWIVQETPAPALTILTTTLPNGNLNVPYSAKLTAVNGALGDSLISFQVSTASANPLPAGLNLDGQGDITGTPLVTGTGPVTFLVDDDNGNRAQQTINITIGQALAALPVTPTPAAPSEPYTLILSAVNGTPPYSWSVVSGNIPNGLFLGASTGEITGAPTGIGTNAAVLQVTDSAVPANVATLPLSIQVENLTFTPTALVDGFPGEPYSVVVPMANGVGPFTPIVTSGQLPPGLAVSQGVVLGLGWEISGTPTTPGVYSFTVRVTDTNGLTASEPYTLVVDPFEILPTILLNGQEGHGYLENLNEQGGTGPYVVSMTSGTLPAGMQLQSIGVLTGVPASGSAGTYTFSVKATDVTGLSVTQSFTFVIFSGNALAITTTALPSPQVGQNYLQNVLADFGTAPYTFSLLNGTLPAGLTLNPSGLLSGIPAPTATGNYSFTVQVVDALGHTATQHFTLTVLPAIAAQ